MSCTHERSTVFRGVRECDDCPADLSVEGRAPSHPFDADPEASLPGVYCRCGYDVDAHADKGNATVRDGRYVLTAPARGAPMSTPTLRDVPLSDDEARELSRAAKQVVAFTERRNQLIREALAAGHGVREVARAVGLNHTTVLNIQKPKQRGTT